MILTPRSLSLSRRTLPLRVSAKSLHMSTLPDTYTGALRPADKPEVNLVRLPLPTPRAGEVLVRNVAAAANPKDFKHSAREKNWSYVPGSDSAGVVVKLGEGAEKEGIELGMRVAAFAKMGTQDSKVSRRRWLTSYQY